VRGDSAKTRNCQLGEAWHRLTEAQWQRDRSVHGLERANQASPVSDYDAAVRAEVARRPLGEAGKRLRTAEGCLAESHRQLKRYPLISTTTHLCWKVLQLQPKHISRHPTPNGTTLVLQARRARSLSGIAGYRTAFIIYRAEVSSIRNPTSISWTCLRRKCSATTDAPPDSTLLCTHRSCGMAQFLLLLSASPQHAKSKCPSRCYTFYKRDQSLARFHRITRRAAMNCLDHARRPYSPACDQPVDSSLHACSSTTGIAPVRPQSILNPAT